MNDELAQIVIGSASRARSELGELPPLLKEHGEGAADQPIKLAIASAIYEIGLIADRVFEQHPHLKQEFETRLEKYGRAY